LDLECDQADTLHDTFLQSIYYESFQEGTAELDSVLTYGYEFALPLCTWVTFSLEKIFGYVIYECLTYGYVIYECLTYGYEIYE
jgi:hypothetical protein